jgi:hypothetical protein
LGFGLGLWLFEGDGLGVGVGLGLVELTLGVGVGLVLGLLVGVGLVLGLLLGVELWLAVGLGLDAGLGLADELLLGAGLAALDVSAWPLAEARMTPDDESVLSVSVGRAPQGDFELGVETSRVPARATPNMLHERMETPANVLSAIAPACRLLIGTAAPPWTSLRDLSVRHDSYTMQALVNASSG